MKNIIFDTDMGPDDAWALIMLLKAEKFRDYRVRGITCVHGNTDTENAAKNTLRVLEMINRTDVSTLHCIFLLKLFDFDGTSDGTKVVKYYYLLL